MGSAEAGMPRHFHV